MTTKTFGQIRVLNDPDNDPNRHTILTFIDQHTFSDARQDIERAGFVVKDSFFGFTVFRTPQDAIESVEAFCKPAS